MFAWKGKGKVMLCTDQIQVCPSQDTRTWPTLTPFETEYLGTDRGAGVHFHSCIHILSVRGVL